MKTKKNKSIGKAKELFLTTNLNKSQAAAIYGVSAKSITDEIEKNPEGKGMPPLRKGWIR